LPTSSPSFGFLAVIVVVVIVAAGVGAGLLYLHNHPSPPAGTPTVALGDNVSVNYIGVFGSGPQAGKIFDTSLQAIATDNASYPKSLEYTPRNASGYTPLPVHVGPNTPSGGYNVSGTTYGGVVTGFWKGLIGVPVNVTRSITVPPDQGYGPLNTSCLVTLPLVQKIPTRVTYTPSAFSSNYTGVSAAAGVTFTDPTYKWSDLVLSANASSIVVERAPSVGTVTSPYGWSILVTNVTSSTITLQSQLTPASVGNVLGSETGLTVCSTTKFLVWSVDLSAGTFVANFNKEVVGQTLVFDVTVVAIASS
jgi:FKBP-type peptidyl-prolyl cis-trans isomerase 2